MSIEAFVEGRSKPLNVIDYTVREDATPLAPGDSSGGIPQISITAKAILTGALKDRTASMIDTPVWLKDSRDIEGTPFMGRGSVYGKITDCSQPGERVTFTADSILTRLNADRTALPFFGAVVGEIEGTRENLVANPSAETNLTGYVAWAGAGGTAALTNPTVTPWVGSKTVKQKWSVAATGTGGPEYTTGSVITEEANYTASGYYRVTKAIPPVGDAPAQSLRMMLRFFDVADVAIGTFYNGTIATVQQTEWQRFSVSGEAPLAAVKARLYCYNVAGTSFSNWAINDEIEVDGLMLEQGGLSDYFDGDFPGSAWTGTAHASTSTTTVTTIGVTDEDSTVGSAFRYYCGLVGIPFTSTSVAEIFETQPVAYPSWSGNVWEHMKKLCVAVGGEIAVVNNIITLRKPRRHSIPIESSELFTQSVSVQNVAQNIDIINYNNLWQSDTTAFTADSIYTLAAGESQEIELVTTASLTQVNNPLAVSTITPQPYTSGTGQYSIIDANSASVDPDWWDSRGGKVEVTIDPEEPYVVHLYLKGARGSGYKAPYRIAEFRNNEAIPALVITGEGVFSNKETIRIPTGASESLTSVEVGSLIDNCFISDISQTYDRGVLAAQQAAGPIVTINGTIGYDPTANGQEFGTIVGGRIRAYDGIYRVTSADYSPGSVSITAVMDMTFDDLADLFASTFDEFNATYSGLTFDAFNALWDPADTFDDFNGQVEAPTFDDFNTLLDGLTFDIYSIFPYIKDAPVDDTESQI